MKVLSILLLVVLLTAALVVPASAQGEMHCSHEQATVESLVHCVHHALEAGHITNQAVAEALLAQLAAAQVALDRDQPAVAVSILRAFINTVTAQSGVTIVDPHGEHLIMHAEMVIAALQ